MKKLAGLLLGAALAAMLIGCPETDEGAGGGSPGFALRVNCGDPNDYVDEEGIKWLADRVADANAPWGADNGLTIDRPGMKIPGSKRPQLYVTEWYSMKGYRFKLANGTYTVRLHFAETFEQHTTAGQRLFSVKINGEEKLKDLDVLKAAGGFAKPLVKEFKIAVTDGVLHIEFVANVQNPEINAIEILRP